MNFEKPVFKPGDDERIQKIAAIRQTLISENGPGWSRNPGYRRNIPPEIMAVINSMEVEAKAKEVAAELAKEASKKHSIGVSEAAQMVRIGKETTPILKEKREILNWNLEARQFRELGETMAEVSFRRSDGIDITPGEPHKKGRSAFEDKDRFISFADYKKIKKNYPDYLQAVEKMQSATPEDRQKIHDSLKKEYGENLWIIQALRHLNGLYSQDALSVIEKDPEFKETPHMVAILEKFTKLVNRQIERKRGVVILEGEAGTGKNKLVDHFAHLTRRPMFRFTCSAGKDEQDFKYLLEYDSKKGTYRIKSTVVEALQTPGAILVFDEINTLKPEVAKILNSLFDHDRALYTGEDREVVKASEGVVLVGLQNPQHYMGVQPLAETIKSRARIMEVSYPPFETDNKEPGKSGKYYRPDEALIIRQYVEKLKAFSDEDFTIVWDSVINKKMSPRAGDLVTPEVKTQIEHIKGIVEIANKIRKAYKAYHEGASDDPISFVFSLRESVECAFELPEIEVTPEEERQGITKAKKAVAEVIMPKIPMGEERAYLQSVIREL